MTHGILKLSCSDQIGLLARISGFFAQRACNLTEVRQHTDVDTNKFFCRVEFERLAGGGDLVSEFDALGRDLLSEWKIRQRTDKYRVAIMVSRDGHCLSDLLWRWRDGSLLFDLAGVISNHKDLDGAMDTGKAPFMHIPITEDGRENAFNKIEDLLASWKVDVVVLARYMQIIPPKMCQKWEGKIINIHHSFLPAFVGGNAYLQAYQRGVKVIGATCHYVTRELDQGPIIEQQVIRASHCHTVGELRKLGQDCERMALSKGLKFHLEDRVFCAGGRTIILGD